MRLAEIAKELRITAQELRRELAKTNFGISPTAHEVDDGLGKGIVRFLKGKVKPTLTHRRVAVVFKEGEGAREAEGATETGEKKPRTPRKKTEAPATQAKPAEAKAPQAPAAPAPTQAATAPSLNVSRRIEVAKVEPSSVNMRELPKTYYKTGKGGKKRPKSAEEAILETMRRHPHTVRHVKRVNYAVGEAGEGGEAVSAEELAIEREKDREMFRAQKKNRALGQTVSSKAQSQIKAKTGVVELPAAISVKEFGEKCGLSIAAIMAALLKNGIMATINQKLDYDTAAIIAGELGVEVKKAAVEASSEQLLEAKLEYLLKEDDASVLKIRPPIVSVMGHVDHGKTKLLDTIRSTNVAAKEAGGITQHIGAYQVEKNGHPITFLDTPGHEAFTAMRARGAKATDIAILVVAADEGVMPQTIEAINHAREASIPIIVALNKVDKPTANLDRIKAELAQQGLQPEEWGGQTIMVPVSALTGDGVEKLLEMVLLVAEVAQLKANPNRHAVGTVIESHLNVSMGPVATILVNTGTLRLGDNVVVGTIFGRIKAMHDHTGKSLREAGPSAAVRISGLGAVPQAGDLLQVFKNEQVAKEKLQELLTLKRHRDEALSGSMVDRIISAISTGQLKLLKVLIKADTQGSLEAILQALQKIKSSDLAIKVIHAGVGNISDSDVIMAAASQALLLGFHVEAGAHVKRLAKEQGAEIRSYTVIYKMIEDMTAILSGMLEPETRVIELGKLEIKQIFLDKKSWLIAGAKVIEGKVQAKSMLRFKKDGELLFETPLESLKHVREDVSEMEKGSECGVQFKTPKPVAVGDVAEVYKVEKIQRTLAD